MKRSRRLVKRKSGDVVLSLSFQQGARVYITARHYFDALGVYVRIVKFLRRAEKTAQLMKKVNTLSSQCLTDWVAMDAFFAGNEVQFEDTKQQEARPQSTEEEGRRPHNEDR